MDAPRDNILRGLAPRAVEIRSTDGGDGDVMVGHFAVFDEWTEINSWFEGNFMERLAFGSFASTFTERAGKIKVLYDHGADPAIGNKPLGVPTVLDEDEVGARYEVSLFDAGYVNELKPALRAGQLGASFRFRVTEESWVNDPVPSVWNPQGLPERTISGVELYEFGPVTFPAYESATAGLRSLTDQFCERLANDPKFVANVARRTPPAGVANLISGMATIGANRRATDEVATIGASQPVPTDDQRQRWLRSRQLITSTLKGDS